MHARIQTHIHVCMYIYIHTYIFKYIYILPGRVLRRAQYLCQLHAAHPPVHIVVHNHQVEAGLARGGALEQEVLRENTRGG